MNSQILPSIIGSIFFGMVLQKIYSKNNEQKIERFVNHPILTKETANIAYDISNPQAEANAFYKVEKIPPKKAPSDLDSQQIPLPKTTDGTVPTVFVPDRTPGMYVLKPRGLGLGDSVRGDINIKAEPICKNGMFGYVTIDEKRKSKGLLHQL